MFPSLSPEKMARKKSLVREYLEAIIIAVVLALVIRHFVVQAFKIPSGSMIPTLLVGDHLLVNKFIYRFRIPKRNEIVVFKFPQDRKTDFIKRVIALPGEEVALKGGRLFVDGEEMPDGHAVYTQKSKDSKERNLVTFKVPRKGDIIKVDGENTELYRRLIANELGVRVEIMAGQVIVQGKRMDSYTVKNDYLFMMGPTSSGRCP